MNSAKHCTSTLVLCNTYKYMRTLYVNITRVHRVRLGGQERPPHLYPAHVEQDLEQRKQHEQVIVVWLHELPREQQREHKRVHCDLYYLRDTQRKPGKLWRLQCVT